MQIVIQRALEKFPGKKPRIISGNGSQFTARDFRQFVRLVGITHVRTSPYDLQSNGKLERWHGSIKQECTRPACPVTIEEARKRVANYVDQYNTVK
ncbi:MAG: transposase family protein [Planctomyces sp.]|nr:transposase family protein [Planctomyces sp.]